MKNGGETFGYFPIFCDLKGKSVVVIGGGGVAQRKIGSLLEAGARVTLISPETTSHLSEIINQGLITHVARNFEPSDLDGAWLVIAATDDENVQAQVYEETRKRRIFCNVVDEPGMCSFIVPSTVRRRELCIAISTGGQSPALAKALRKDLEKRFGDEWGIFVSLLGRLRALVIKRYPGHTAMERCTRLAELEVPEWIRQNRWEKVRKWAVEICGEEAVPIVQEFSENG